MARVHTDSQALLGELEQAVLIAVQALGQNAYGVNIQRELKKRTGKNYSTGAVYAVLIRLEEKTFLSSYVGEPSPERGGRRKRYYEITVNGNNALIASKRHLDALWDGVVLA